MRKRLKKKLAQKRWSGFFSAGGQIIGSFSSLTKVLAKEYPDGLPKIKYKITRVHSPRYIYGPMRLHCICDECKEVRKERALRKTATHTTTSSTTP